ncbi:DUF6894 family protein [Methylobacterium sp. P31]
MPARFYFDIEVGDDTIKDEIGAEAAGLDEALAEARPAVAEMAEDIGAGETLVMVVRDADDTPVARLPIKRPPAQ